MARNERRNCYVVTSNNRSQTRRLPITHPNAIPMGYGRLFGIGKQMQGAVFYTVKTKLLVSVINQ